MTAIAVEFQPVTSECVKRLARVEGACVSIFLPSYQQGSSGARSDVLLHSFIKQAAEKLLARGVSTTDLEDLLEPVRTWQATDERLRHGHSDGLAVFRAAGRFEVFALPVDLHPAVFVEAAFRILPLLEFTSTPNDLWVLALTRKGIRLLHNGKRAALPASIPATLDQFLALGQPDHRLQNRTSVGPSVGNMKAMSFGTGSELEAKDKHYRDYCLAIDRGLAGLFEHSKPHLVLAGAVSEIAIYRRANTYPGLLPQVVSGSPDDGVMSDGELTAAALKILAANPSAAEMRANAHVFGAMGSARIVTELTALVRFAAKGKIGEVFIATGLSASGDVDHITGRVRMSGDIVANDDDLFNAAAVQTLNHSGEVFVVPPDRIPGGFGAVGALRY